MRISSSLFPTLLLAVLWFAAGCRPKEAVLTDTPKVIPLSGGADTLYIERSKFWDDAAHRAPNAKNRQTIHFEPGNNPIVYVTLQNSGGVPMRHDTLRGARVFSADEFVRNPINDTNLHIRIDFPDYRKPYTDVNVYVRNQPDSVYKDIYFRGK